jgi:hypothetical protein
VVAAADRQGRRATAGAPTASNWTIFVIRRWHAGEGAGTRFFYTFLSCFFISLFSAGRLTGRRGDQEWLSAGCAGAGGIIGWSLFFTAPRLTFYSALQMCDSQAGGPLRPGRRRSHQGPHPNRIAVRLHDARTVGRR